MIEIAFADASFAKLQQYGALVEFEMTRHTTDFKKTME
jgi:hypothetical protein